MINSNSIIENFTDKELDAEINLNYFSTRCLDLM